MSILPSTTSIHISPFKISCYCFIAKIVSPFFPHFGVSATNAATLVGGRNRCRFHSRPLIMSTSFLPSFPPALHAKLPLPLWVPLSLDPALPPLSFLSSFLFGLHWFLVRRRAGLALLCRLRGAGDESEAVFVQDTQSRLS